MLSNSDIMDAMDTPRFVAIFFSISINSGSSVILVWCPDKDTEIFFI